MLLASEMAGKGLRDRTVETEGDRDSPLPRVDPPKRDTVPKL